MMNVINSPNKKWYAEISACHGGNITKLQYENKDIFIPLISEKQLDKNPYIIGCPILLPANRTLAGEFSFEGKKYNLPINEPENNAHLHGLVHASVFDVVKAQDNKITLEYVNNGEIYPFHFKLEVEYVLKNEGLYQYYRIKNIDKINLPFTFALHTSFVEPESFSVPIACCQEKDEHHIPTGNSVPLNSQEKLYTSGSKSKGIVISGSYKSNGNTADIGDIKYTVSHNFNYWILFNGKGESGFLCVEPQCGAVNGLNTENEKIVLKPNESVDFYTIIEKI